MNTKIETRFYIIVEFSLTKYVSDEIMHLVR